MILSTTNDTILFSFLSTLNVFYLFAMFTWLGPPVYIKYQLECEHSCVVPIL